MIEQDKLTLPDFSKAATDLSEAIKAGNEEAINFAIFNLMAADAIKNGSGTQPSEKSVKKLEDERRKLKLGALDTPEKNRIDKILQSAIDGIRADLAQAAVLTDDRVEIASLAGTLFSEGRGGAGYTNGLLEQNNLPIARVALKAIVIKQKEYVQKYLGKDGFIDGLEAGEAQKFQKLMKTIAAVDVDKLDKTGLEQFASLVDGMTNAIENSIETINTVNRGKTGEKDYAAQLRTAIAGIRAVINPKTQYPAISSTLAKAGAEVDKQEKEKEVFQVAAEAMLRQVALLLNATPNYKMNKSEVEAAIDYVFFMLCDEPQGPRLELNKEQRTILKNQFVSIIKNLNQELIEQTRIVAKERYDKPPEGLNELDYSICVQAAKEKTALGGKLKDIMEGRDLVALKAPARSLKSACEFAVKVQTRDKEKLDGLRKKIRPENEFIVATSSQNARAALAVLLDKAQESQTKVSSTLMVNGLGELTRKDAKSQLAEQLLFSGVRMFFTHPVRTTLQALGFAPSRDAIARDLAAGLGVVFVREKGQTSVKMMDPSFQKAFNAFSTKMKQGDLPQRFKENWSRLAEIITDQTAYAEIWALAEERESLKGVLPKYSKFIGSPEQMLDSFKRLLGSEDGKKLLIKYFEDKDFASLQTNPEAYEQLRITLAGYDIHLLEIGKFADFAMLKSYLETFNPPRPEITKFVSEHMFNERDFNEMEYGLVNFNNICFTPKISDESAIMWQDNLARQIQTVADGMKSNRILQEQEPPQQLKSLEEYADNLLELLGQGDAVAYYGKEGVEKMKKSIGTVRQEAVSYLYEPAKIEEFGASDQEQQNRIIEELAKNMEEVRKEVRNMGRAEGAHVKRLEKSRDTAVDLTSQVSLRG